jgi:CHASE3 domain sensor protein
MMKNPDSKTIPGMVRRGPPLPPKPLFGFSLALTAIVAIALISYQSLQAAISASRNLTQSVEVLGQLNTVLSTLKDAETGQRGYLLTGEESYLEPYSSAVTALPGEFSTLHGLMANRPQQQKRLEALESIADQKINELRQTVDLRRAGQASAALAIVHTDRGKILMDRLRAAIGDMDAAERQLIGRRSEDWQSAAEFFGGDFEWVRSSAGSHHIRRDRRVPSHPRNYC